MDETNIYALILYIVATCKYVSRKHFLALPFTDSYIYERLRFALSCDHIKQNIVTEKVRSKNRNTIYYSITEAGVEHLIQISDSLPSDMQWVKHLKKELASFQNMKTSGLRHNDRMVRFLCISGATVFALAAGARAGAIDIVDNKDERCEASYEVKPQPCEANVSANALDVEDLDDFFDDISIVDFPDDDFNIKNSGIQRALSKSEEQEQKQNGMILNLASDIKFVNAYGVKKAIIEAKAATPLLHYGTFSGIAESQFTSVLVYTSRKSGNIWTSRNIQMDVKLLHVYLRRFSEYNSFRLNEDRAVMIVDNAKAFGDLFVERRKRKYKGSFPYSFSSFIIFPCNKIGASQFSVYMHTDMKNFKSQFVEMAIGSGVYTQNTGSYAGEFPLLNQNGTKMMLGTFIDAVQIRHILSLYAKDPFEFGVICYEWQKDYYRRVFPEETNYMTVK